MADDVIDVGGGAIDASGEKPQEFQLPEDFVKKGFKAPEDVFKGYGELESKLGEQGQELGYYRQGYSALQEQNQELVRLIAETRAAPAAREIALPDREDDPAAYADALTKRQEEAFNRKLAEIEKGRKTESAKIDQLLQSFNTLTNIAAVQNEFPELQDADPEIKQILQADPSLTQDPAKLKLIGALQRKLRIAGQNTAESTDFAGGGGRPAPKRPSAPTQEEVYVANMLGKKPEELVANRTKVQRGGYKEEEA